ncbi:D-alanyl-D-alanine carboxypeptidase [Sulfurifustis variabilis]|uniref:serine-type D-Ala-D-Ala carboxypeptidase n=1 Tax=Sulfurifustis variabilis TaxID=1675686 RepID=A0A1B4VCS1_9GAMM|nr:D-alanyl-D-alanine carboxypeptidase family protein [Sulfurifustis variabilis]BAU46757.1 D-alanyl-D-alanine carboxypeptidase [Sulfurifustis variabilis]
MRRLHIIVGLLLLTLLAPAHAALEKAPEVPARAWLLVDHHSGSVLAEHDADEPMPPASLTKLMTAYLVLEKLRAGEVSLRERVTVSDRAAGTPGANIFLRPGGTPILEDLLKSAIVRSANDATVALAEHVAGSESRFVELMNVRARSWGLAGTRFVNSTGLDAPGHVSTARDLSRLAVAMIRDFPEHYEWFGLREISVNELKYYNNNALLWRDTTVDGLKTGFTHAAGWCLVGSARRENMRLIATVLGAPSEAARVDAAQRLLDYGFRNFETKLLYAADRPTTEVRVWMGEQATLPLGVRQNLYVTLPRGWYSRLRARLTIKEMLEAPVRQGQRIGVLALQLDDKVFAEYPLVALRDVGTGGWTTRAMDSLRLWFR